MEIVDQVQELVATYLRERGIDLVDITYRREHQGMVLRLLVDTREGISMKECESLNNFLANAMEESNIIDGHYVIEVSSPGLDRPMVSDRDFERAMDKALSITTYEPIDGKRSHDGTLLGMDKENIVIESNGVSTVILRNKIAKATLKIEF